MSCEDLQEEELEVLSSIYDGDQNFKKISSTCFQYKIGIDDDPKSFLLEISWGKDYPNEPPGVNLDAFYNKKLISDVKNTIISKVLEEADGQIGTPMTYTLIEWAKENAEELTKLQPEKLISPESNAVDEKISDDMVSVSIKKEKKIQLSKQQKKKLAERLDAKGERPRGWDWVDVVKHLSQIGPKQTISDEPS